MYDGKKGLIGYLTQDVFRFREVLLVTGFPVYIAVLRLGEIPRQATLPITLEFAGYYLLNLASWNINSWFNYSEDLHNPRFRGLSFVTKPAFLWVAIISLVIAIGLSAPQNLHNAIVFIVYFLLWAIYSAPRWGLKYHSPWGTLLHFANMLFLLGAAWGKKEQRLFTVEIIMLALLFAAGHVVHELIDFDSDKAQSSKGLAVSRGKKFASRVFLAIMTIVAILALVDLLLNKSTTRVLLFFAATILTILFFLWQTLFLNKSDQNVFLRIRAAYRLLFGVFGITGLLLLH